MKESAIHSLMSSMIEIGMSCPRPPSRLIQFYLMHNTYCVESYFHSKIKQEICFPNIKKQTSSSCNSFLEDYPAIDLRLIGPLASQRRAQLIAPGRPADELLRAANFETHLGFCLLFFCATSPIVLNGVIIQSG